MVVFVGFGFSLQGLDVSSASHSDTEPRVNTRAVEPEGLYEEHTHKYTYSKLYKTFRIKNKQTKKNRTFGHKHLIGYWLVTFCILRDDQRNRYHLFIEIK